MIRPKEVTLPGSLMSFKAGRPTSYQRFFRKESTALLRKNSGLEHCRTVRREGAPIPLLPLKRWDNGKDVVLAGDVQVAARREAREVRRQDHLTAVHARAHDHAQAAAAVPKHSANATKVKRAMVRRR